MPASYGNFLPDKLFFIYKSFLNLIAIVDSLPDLILLPAILFDDQPHFHTSPCHAVMAHTHNPTRHHFRPALSITPSSVNPDLRHPQRTSLPG